MNHIKSTLKNIGITLAEFAKKLDISRPTLDSYIEMYELDKSLPKEKYQIIFDKLFTSAILDKESFMKNLDDLHYLIERDKMLGTFELDCNKTDLITSVIDEMKQDMYMDDCDINLYIFINMLIRSYKNNSVFKNLVKYFLVLNGRIPLQDMTLEDEKYFSNYFRVFYNEIHGQTFRDEEYSELFKNRVEELAKDSQKKSETLQKSISQVIDLKIKSLIDMGIDIDDIDLKQVLNEVNITNKQLYDEK